MVHRIFGKKENVNFWPKNVERAKKSSTLKTPTSRLEHILRSWHYILLQVFGSQGIPES